MGTGKPEPPVEGTDAELSRAIEAFLPSVPRIVEVARSLSISVRTLQRRLSDEHTTYRQLVDRCRRDVALRELGRGELTITEIAYRLGYSDISHFVRAFRRWTGQPPTRFRAASAPAARAERVRE